MANYTSQHTGNNVDTAVSTYLSKSEASSTYLTQADAANLYPIKTGVGASGTWPINISGNAINDENGRNIVNTYLTKTQLIDLLTENTFPGFGAYNSGSLAGYIASSQTYVITSAVTSSTWGSGVLINSSATSGFHLPYGQHYRFSAEVKVPTAHTIVIDYNNYAVSGTSWSGNDNDLGSDRLNGTGTSGVSFTIPANTWTKIVFGTSNLHSSNTNHVDLYIVDGIGLVTSGDSSATTWYMRKVKMQLGTVATDWTPAGFK